MVQQVKTVVSRSGMELVQDLVGAVALIVILVGSLHLPGLV
ncbi:hypothetical protein [Pseudooceanicola nanhaiensis]|nr:hypothetical protein [Pseudooceanicola nanhaiensis]